MLITLCTFSLYSLLRAQRAKRKKPLLPWWEKGFRDEGEKGVSAAILLLVAIQTRAVTVHVLVAAPTLRMRVDVVVEGGMTLDAHRIGALIVAGGAIGDLTPRDLTVEIG